MPSCTIPGIPYLDINKIVKNVKIVESRDNIWNHHEKCIHMSTNMPGIGSLIREIAVEISEMCESYNNFAH